jgi:RNA polymerase sigma factor (sigma-70 family)
VNTLITQTSGLSTSLLTSHEDQRPAARSFLGRQDEWALIQRAQGGDRAALDRLITANTQLVYKVARRYRCRSYSLDDLVQEGVVGLIHAIERFDATRGCRLSTYAMHWIRQAIARAVEQNDRLIHIPMHTNAEIRRLVKLREERQLMLGRNVTESELAAETGIEEERVTQLLSTVQDAVSLESLVGPENEGSLMDVARDDDALDPEADALSGVYRQHLRTLLEDLRPRERQVLEERYGFGGQSPQTLEELSRRMRVSRERVRQIEVQAIRKLRRALSATHWD